MEYILLKTHTYNNTQIKNTETRGKVKLFFAKEHKLMYKE